MQGQSLALSPIPPLPAQHPQLFKGWLKASGTRKEGKGNMLKSLLCAGHDRGISFDFAATPGRDGDSAMYI